MNIIEKKYNWAYQPGKRVSTGYLIIHHAAAKSCSADDVHRWHLANGWAGIGYNFFVRKDGSVYRGRPEDAVGAHTVGYNSMSIGICFEGNYDVETKMPEAQLKAGHELLAYLRGKYPNAKVGKHKDYDSTACPGRYFPWNDLLNGPKDSTPTTPAKPAVVNDNDEEVCEVKVPMLEKGDDNGYVKTVQILLNKYDGAKLAEDGDFGPATYAAVRSYQKSRGLGVDGIVGPATWAQLLK